MRFVVDECTGPAVAEWLRREGHDVLSVYEERRGISDDEVLALAVRESRVIVTNDKDFGEMVFRHGSRHRGVILLRLADERASSKISVLSRLLSQYGPRIADGYVVATETGVRFGR
jgi:predicted nuclease of predicted toxin-antitoxin system